MDGFGSTRLDETRHDQKVAYHPAVEVLIALGQVVCALAAAKPLRPQMTFRRIERNSIKQLDVSYIIGFVRYIEHGPPQREAEISPGRFAQ